MHSSYTVNNFEEIFKAVVSAYQPKTCVELGVLEGYSAIAIGKALKENFEKFGSFGHLDAYDLFEDYPYRHSSLEVTQKNIVLAGLDEFVTLQRHDAFKVHELYNPNSVELLHIDLSNTGAILKDIVESWDSKMVYGGAILFEGGSEERDNIDWMRKYGAPSIKEELESNKMISEKYVFGTYFKFPSLTCLLKKR